MIPIPNVHFDILQLKPLTEDDPAYSTLQTINKNAEFFTGKPLLQVTFRIGVGHHFFNLRESIYLVKLQRTSIFNYLATC